MAHIPEHELLDQIERFLAATGMGQTAFGKGAINDANLLAQLKGGRELRRDTRARVTRYITDHSCGGAAVSSDASTSEAL